MNSMLLLVTLFLFVTKCIYMELRDLEFPHVAPGTSDIIHKLLVLHICILHCVVLYIVLSYHLFDLRQRKNVPISLTPI
jgi:hypothetical protein